jgi:alkaline phosphatase/streptomycin-6-phosphatase
MIRKKAVVAGLAATTVIAAAGMASAAASGAFSSAQGTEAHSAPRGPKNVIFLLGDGMGTQEITAARYYQGVQNKLNVDRAHYTGFDTTWSVKPAAKPP